MQLRGFIDENHQPTPWGKVLEACLSPLAGRQELEESALLAIELLRYGVLNSESVLQDDFRGLMTGNGKLVLSVLLLRLFRMTSPLDEEKAACMLVSRVASLGRLHHKAKGYSGPLSRPLLAYHSIISSLQGGLRDLVEMILLATLLEGGIERERQDWMELSVGYVPQRVLLVVSLTQVASLSENSSPVGSELPP